MQNYKPIDWNNPPKTPFEAVRTRLYRNEYVTVIGFNRTGLPCLLEPTGTYEIWSGELYYPEPLPPEPLPPLRLPDGFTGTVEMRNGQQEFAIVMPEKMAVGDSHPIHAFYSPRTWCRDGSYHGNRHPHPRDIVKIISEYRWVARPKEVAKSYVVVGEHKPLYAADQFEAVQVEVKAEEA